MKYDTRYCWLPFLGSKVPADISTCRELAEAELTAGLRALSSKMVVITDVLPDQDEGYEVIETTDGLSIRGGDRGILYGAYALLMRLAAGLPPTSGWSEPCHALRMLNHWDNMDGRVERGYAGGSLFFRDGKFAYDINRLRQYGRYLASIGINVVSINNVNVHAPADQLITDMLLPEVKRVADILRPFGIRLLIAIDYALPVTSGLETADPLDSAVGAWWRRQVDKVYLHIPDLCGFLVKADSEFRPGPFLYKRDHAQGARVLAQALKPHGGLLVWRCFVYNCKQDWRDRETDRPKAAYDTYAPLDGQFDDNVILQIKHGPYDFQVREPASPLFFAMPATRKAMELQLAQEYTGQQIDLYYMLPQWRELRVELGGQWPEAISAVSNLGNDANWTGHDLAQANLFAYGQLAWHGNVDAGAITRWWIRLTFGLDAAAEDLLFSMLQSSREIYESYTAPLGLCWMVNPNHHYGPNPGGYEYAAWGTYLRATRDAIGIDRSVRGTGFAQQYPPALADMYDDINTCPESLLLFFHRLPYDYRLKDGKTLVQRVYDLHFEGAKRAEAMASAWETFAGKVPQAAYENIRERLARQIVNAREWRDVINSFFYRFSGIPDEQHRAIYE